MANNNFQILLKGMIDPQSQATIEKQIKTLSASIKEHIRLKVQIDSTQFNTIFQEINKLQQHINILSQNPISNANMSEFSEYVKQAGLNLDSVSKQMRQVSGESPKITKETRAWSNQIGESVKITTNLNRASKDYGNSVINVNNSLKQQKQLQQQLELFQQKMLGGNGIAGQIDILGEKFKKIDPNVLSQLRNDVQNLNVTTPNLNQQMKLTTVRLNNIKTAAMQSGSVFTRMVENMYKFLRFYIAGGAIVRVINTFRNMISTLTEIDTELTQLRKVTGETLDTMADFAFVANDTGKNLGATTQEVINATTEFARLGYTIKDASKLAEESILFSTVGNMSVERASSALISTVKAFGIEVDEQGENIRSIIDMVNEVGNRFAISQEDIAEILRRSSSAMREAGNTIEEVIALGTSGQEVVQNSQQIGTALRTISMRKIMRVCIVIYKFNLEYAGNPFLG